MHLGGTESIKSFLENSHSTAFISMRAVRKELQYGELKIIQVKDLQIVRNFSFIYLYGQPDKFSTMFMRYTKQYYKEKRSEEHTSELQSLMRISYAVFCLKKKKTIHIKNNHIIIPKHILSYTTHKHK